MTKKMLLLCLLILPCGVFASWWDSVWWRADQQGAKALSHGDPRGAARLFKQPQWRGVAYYKGGQYELALNSFQQSKNPEAYYNQGNALAHLGRVDDAISAYEQAIKLRPQFSDAIYNRDLLKKLKQQQQKKSPQANHAEQQQKPSNKNDKSSNKNQAQMAKNEDKSTEKKPADNVAKTTAAEEHEQTVNQALQRIPDDPGDLLKQIFRRDYMRRHGVKPDGEEENNE